VTNDVAHLRTHLDRTYARKTAVYTKQQSNARFMSGDVTIVNVRDSVTPDVSEDKTIDCPVGYQAIDGGWTATVPGTLSDNGSGPLIAGQSHPGATEAGTYSHATGWYFRVFNFTNQAREYGAAVICVRPGG
jgi:hypothetical protein